MPSPQTTNNDDADERKVGTSRDSSQQNEKLFEAFKARLRLHGTQLPKDYTTTLRLRSNNDAPNKASARRRNSRPIARHRRPSHTSESDSAPTAPTDTSRTPASAGVDQDQVEVDNIDTDSEEDALARSQNAYPGSTNNILSVHQRRGLYCSMDRAVASSQTAGNRQGA
ncbi:hypothetical protein OPT61_g4367 [Boeremia exigua]|uniref:Uncharacterized protein n=1 Tax=Boeremia exigua TaxID=749465 RepID=A0ACC2IEI4_9PLEO|nr:hypothetical protein OPT61_g4367 [Boeremia exigua]